MSDYYFAWAYTYMGIQQVRVAMENDTEAAVIWESCGLRAAVVPKSQVFATEALCVRYVLGQKRDEYSRINEECINLMDRLVVAEEVK